ncbi:hypothetical protein TRFO_30176 [Tritrichomonas foetus]|uniref:Importin N-terminal domain-containing protein n=1 Tax=Tritrichomonas foetus TaxID=1144522 RepID=A0A1J4JYV0_9EUKA|nr:hypothetical protein TRFO_30176 [Tritrichomonas foetus]|eukprot:OHT02678.1 hypothetical protein TRFO_30176 [Tritrichomonas foetus]
MECNIDTLLQIFDKLSHPMCSQEDRITGERIINEFLQTSKDVYLLFVQIISQNQFSDAIEFNSFAGIKRWIFYHKNELSQDEFFTVVGVLIPLIFGTKKVSNLLRDLFQNIARNSAFQQHWEETLKLGQNLLQNAIQENNIDQIESVLKVLSIISGFYHQAAGRKGIDLNLISNFFSISSLFIKPEFLTSEAGFRIVKYALKSIHKIILKTLLVDFHEELEKIVINLFPFFSICFNLDLPSLSGHHPNDNQTSNDYLSLLKQISNIVYDYIYLSDDISEELSSFINAWKPEGTLLIWNKCVYLYNLDKNYATVISKLLRPLIYGFHYHPNFVQFLTEALNFIEIPSNDLQDFLFNPAVFYITTYTLIRDEYGGLRNNTLLILIRSISKFNLEQMTHFYEMLSMNCNEASVIVASKLVKKAIKRGAQPAILNFITKCIQSNLTNENNVILIGSTLYLLSKTIKLYSIYPAALEKIFKFASTLIFKKTNVVCQTLALRLLVKMKKAGIQFPLNDEQKIQFLNCFVQLTYNSITESPIVLISYFAEENPNLYSYLHLNNFTIHLLSFISNELNEELDFTLYDKRQKNLLMSLTLLKDLIKYNKDGGIEEPLFKLFFVCLLSKTYDLIDILSEILEVMIEQDNPRIGSYINQIFFLLNSGEFSPNNILNLLVPFLKFIHKYPAEFIDQFIFNEFQTLSNLLSDTNKIGDENDRFCVSILLCWIFQMQPQLCENPNFFLDYYIKTEGTDPKLATYFAPSYFNLIVTFILIHKIELTPELLQRLLGYYESKLFLREIDVLFHSMALKMFAQQMTYNCEHLCTFAQFLENNREKIVNRESCYSNIYSESNLPYPIMWNQ